MFKVVTKNGYIKLKTIIKQYSIDTDRRINIFLRPNEW